MAQEKDSHGLEQVLINAFPGYCVLNIYCGLNCNAFKLLLIDHIGMDDYVIGYFTYICRYYVISLLSCNLYCRFEF